MTQDKGTVRWGQKRFWRKCDIYKIIFAHFLTFVSLQFVCFFPLARGNIPTSDFTANCPTWSVGVGRRGETHCILTACEPGTALFKQSYNQNKPHHAGGPPNPQPRPSPNVASCRFLPTPQLISSCLKILLRSPAPTFLLSCWFYVCCDTGRGTGLSTSCIKEGMSKPLCHGPRDTWTQLLEQFENLTFGHFLLLFSGPIAT